MGVIWSFFLSHLSFPLSGTTNLDNHGDHPSNGLAVE